VPRESVNSTLPARAPARQTRRQLLDAAERLFVAHGIEDVSLRAIIREAGQRNQSALQYHFGDRDGLLAAIQARRVEQLEKKRRALLERALRGRRRLGVREACAVLVRAGFETCREDRSFREFLGRFGLSLLASDESLLTIEPITPSQVTLFNFIHQAMGGLQPALHRFRMENASGLALQALSRRARAGGSFRGARAELFCNNLVDQLAGMLLAPVSPETAALLVEPSRRASA